MTGPEHFREAERIISHIMNQEDVPVEVLTSYATAAQVHATLALAAAAALNDADGSGMGLADWQEWALAASVSPPADHRKVRA